MVKTLGTLSQYGIPFQIKVLAALITKKEFLQNISDIINVDDFENKAHKWIIDSTLSYYRQYHTVPSMDSLAVEVKKVEDDILKVSLIDQLKEIYKTSDDDLEYAQQEFLSFCKNQLLKRVLLESVDLLNIADYDGIRTLINDALKAGQEKNIGHEYNLDVESRYKDDDRGPVPTPWDTINDITQGGLGKGDLGLIFGNPGGGKSWALIALGGYAASLGYNVLHYTLELGESYVGKRYDAYFTQIPVQNIGNHKNEVEDIVKQLQGRVIIKEFPAGKASLSNIESHINQCKNNSFEPDLILIDYLDLLRSRKHRKERKDEIDDVYLGARGLARELKVPIWSPSQVNRAGAKDDVIEGDKASGSYDKIMTGDFSISLSRKKKDKVDGTGRWHIMKNRYGPDGMTYNSYIDTSTGHIEMLDEFEEGQSSPPPSQTSSSNKERRVLKEKFFELEHKSF